LELMPKRKRFTCGLLWMAILIATGLQTGLRAQSTQQPESVNVVDGAAGPCSVEFTVADASGKPVYAALINVHMAYGFMGLRKLDLSVYTNTAGKARFTGLPEKVQKPPLVFRASKEKETGSAIYNPATECQTKHDIMLKKL